MVKLFVSDNPNCPKCSCLEKKMKAKNIEFEIAEDNTELAEKGFLQAPILKVGDGYLEFVQANTWVNNQ